MASNGHHLCLRREPRFLNDLGKDHSKSCARLDQLGRNIEGQAKRFKKRPGPILLHRIVELGRRGICALALRHARETMRDQIWNHEKLLRLREGGIRILHHGTHLREGVDVHELNAGFLKNGVSGNPLKEVIHHALITRVTIVAKVGKELSIGI